MQHCNLFSTTVFTFQYIFNIQYISIYLLISQDQPFRLQEPKIDLIIKKCAKLLTIFFLKFSKLTCLKNINIEKS